jgi:5-methylcytosine-specific restriction protein A
MNTYLFARNPAKWPWPEISEAAAQLRSGSKVQEAWNCVSHKKIKPGDRAFISRVGSAPRGLFASGHVASEPFLSRSRKGNPIYNVTINFDVLLDPDHEPILTTEVLNIGKLATQLWTPQSSGIVIKSGLVWELEALWKDFLAHKEIPDF